jgi:hypothetical protein
MRKYVIAVALGLLFGWGVPVAAQVASRLYGTTSTGEILPVLIDTSGRLVVVGQ